MAAEQQPAEGEKPPLFRRVFPYFLRFLRVLVVLALLLDGCACGLVAKGSVDSNTLNNQAKAFNVLAQAGFMIIVILLIIAEFGFKWFTRVFYLFHYWTGRGLALGWLGIQAINSVEQLQTSMATTQSTIDANAVDITGNVVGWTLISCGLLYVLMNFLCLQSLTGAATLEELESGLLGGSDNNGSSPYDNNNKENTRPLNAEAVRVDEEDAQLLINAAEALGLMNVRDLRSKFGGRDGRRTAITHFQNGQKQLEEVTALRNELKLLKQQAQSAAGGKQQQPQRKQTMQAQATPTSSGSFSQSGGGVPASATAPPPSTIRRGADDDEDDPRARRQQEDDDLESQYYNSQRGM